VCVAACYSVLQRAAVFGSMLQRVATCCNVLQYLAMATCHAATYNVTLFATQDILQHKLHWHRYKLATEALKSAVCKYICIGIATSSQQKPSKVLCAHMYAVCCSVLQCVAVCCSVLQLVSRACLCL